MSSSRETYRKAIESHLHSSPEDIINAARNGILPPWYMGDPVSNALYNHSKIKRRRLR